MNGGKIGPWACPAHDFTRKMGSALCHDVVLHCHIDDTIFESHEIPRLDIPLPPSSLMGHSGALWQNRLAKYCEGISRKSWYRVVMGWRHSDCQWLYQKKKAAKGWVVLRRLSTAVQTSNRSGDTGAVSRTLDRCGLGHITMQLHQFSPLLFWFWFCI